MKIPKNFIYFIVVAQGLITLGNYAVYASLMAFFPSLLAHSTIIFILFMLLSVSFLGMSIVTFHRESKWLRMPYILSAIWLPTWFYLLMAALATIIVNAIWPAGTLITPKIIFGIALLLCLYGIINARITRVINLKISLPNLPEYWKGKTAIMASDLHLGHILRKGFAQRIIKQINSLKPDIVFLPGDFYDGVKTDFTYLAGLFKELKSTHGTYYVTGNHEEIAGYEICEKAISGGGIHILENQMVDINGLQVAGLAYYSESKETPEGISQLISSMKLDPLKPTVLLKHVPNLVAAISKMGVHLQLSGHTHLGQVWPFRYATRRVYKGFDYGLKTLENYKIYTSSGAGTWGPPVRIFTKSEMVRIEFE